MEGLIIETNIAIIDQSNIENYVGILLSWLTTVCEDEDEDGGEDVDAIHGWAPPDPGDLVRAVMAASATPQALRWQESQDTGTAMWQYYGREGIQKCYIFGNKLLDIFLCC